MVMNIEVTFEEMEQDVERYLRFVEEDGATLRIIIDGKCRAEVIPYRTGSEQSKLSSTLQNQSKDV